MRFTDYYAEQSCTINPGSLADTQMVDNFGAVRQEKCTVKPASDQEHMLDCRILLAEDGPDNQRLFRHILVTGDADVVIVENGQDAVDKAMEAVARGTPFDLILMDMQMPVLTGYEATRLLREKDYTGPIIALTAMASDSDREQCLQAGCTDFISKPVDRRVLLEAVRGSISMEQVACLPVAEVAGA